MKEHTHKFLKALSESLIKLEFEDMDPRWIDPEATDEDKHDNARIQLLHGLMAQVFETSLIEVKEEAQQSLAQAVALLRRTKAWIDSNHEDVDESAAIYSDTEEFLKQQGEG